MQVALYARVSTPHQQQEGTIASQVQALTQYIHQQEWSLLPDHAYLDEGLSGGGPSPPNTPISKKAPGARGSIGPASIGSVMPQKGENSMLWSSCPPIG